MALPELFHFLNFYVRPTVKKLAKNEKNLSKHLKRIQKDFKKVKMKKKHLTDLEKGKALAWLEEKINRKDIAQSLGVSRSTIERLAKKRKQNPSLVPTRKVGSGRKKIASKSLIKFIEKKISENPKMTSKEMKAKYKKTLGQLSERTIRRILLNDLNIPSYIAIKKPLLTKAHKEK